MRRFLVGGLSILLLTAPARADEAVSGRCVGVQDGDSIAVVLEGVETSVRLEGIDAPELGQEYSRRAKAALAALVHDRHVLVVPKETDAYGRLVARVFAGGTDTSSTLR